ncbi:hypothetical protein L6654_38770 [Bradyrhizobium sp. WYCCWR 13023]|uniref:Uncharacterized protein n=1 Tax=Bradyrhizobium zhengyangense TaxID=2911009 RepID=A0A9X1RJJ7_9BRAD|nr:hypothetical protein [Bradyrhizobium zhengyangense]MCG2632553.1 hypothetical protein [Bradyrhizobium zhengyangense]
MKIAIPHSAIRLPLAFNKYDSLIIVVYVLLALISITAVYLAAGQPGITQAELATAAALP